MGRSRKNTKQCSALNKEGFQCANKTSKGKLCHVHVGGTKQKGG